MSNGNGQNAHAINTLTPPPFNMNFQWKDKTKTIQLKNGEDILKLAEIFKSLLDQHGIEYEEKES